MNEYIRTNTHMHRHSLWHHTEIHGTMYYCSIHVHLAYFRLMERT